ncbi:hypothetical protein [Enterococcus sp.]|jgi:hypothetical protein|uniref:hypothetical protein n=1 Tax=Enterococcus sp. TaxID=35783 RepID=UPI0025BFAF78|nr:hypothetical protein [Enterococcus sp.]
MKRYLAFLGAYLIVQPSFILGIAEKVEETNQESSETVSLPAVVEYQNNQVKITKANQKKEEKQTTQSTDLRLNHLENYLAMLEAGPNLVEGKPGTTQLGKKMKCLSKTILFTG